MKKILYVGPSWAYRSYDTPEGLEENFTNLYIELGLQKLNAVNLSFSGASNQYFIDQFTRPNHPDSFKEDYDAIIWIYCEPLKELGIKMKDFLTSNDPWDIRGEANKKLLDQMSKIGKPIGLIGSHSDVFDCDYSNITIIHPSWQQFLANYAGVALKQGWGADESHRALVVDYTDIKPSNQIVDAMVEQFDVWHRLEYNRLFSSNHTNKKGNELFAKEIQSSIESFINNL
jgi:hypothetical protein